MADSAEFFLGASGNDAGFDLVEEAAGDVAGMDEGEWSVIGRALSTDRSNWPSRG